MGRRFVVDIEDRHFGWLPRHAARLGYFGVKDYVNAILATALNSEEQHSEAPPPCDVPDEDPEIEDELQIELPFPPPEPAAEDEEDEIPF